MQPLFTIGHSNHKIDALLDLLRARQLTAVADVRSSPYSQRLPQFNREPFQHALRQEGFHYVFLGEQLGARRQERSCYVCGQARYDLIKDLPEFRLGLQRVLQGSQTHCVALLCAEKDPLTCHRSILICRELAQLQPDLPIQHILEDGELESREQSEQRLLRMMRLQPELFDGLDQIPALIQKAYDMQAERIAYREKTE